MQTPRAISELNTYLVGGAVRDTLLNREILERDFLVVGATSEQMIALGFEQVGRDFPVFLHPKTKDEYALARTERKQGHGYTGFTCFASPDVTIEEDLIRRDLTVNAMAMDENGNIIDPYNGQADLEKKILRHVSPAFIEDPLRVLRVARFAARYFQYGFSIATETLALMQSISESGELQALSAERIWKETQRSLLESNPEVFFNTLYDCGALKEIWPSLHQCWMVPNTEKHHPEIYTGVHTMMALKQAVLLSRKCDVRFAVVCHDLGKGLTPIEELPSHKTHEKLGLPLVKNICENLKVPNHYKSLALKVCEFHLHCHRAFELKPSTILKLFDSLDVWRKPEEFNDFLLACQADALGRKGFEHNTYPQKNYLEQLAKAALQVSAKTFVKQGLKGLEIRNAINNERLSIIKDKVSSLQNNGVIL